MAKTYRKKPHKKFLVQEAKLEVEAPDFHNMSREDIVYYLEHYEVKEQVKANKKKKQISRRNDNSDF